MYPIWKRAFDIFWSVPGVVVTLFFLPFVGLAILIESGFPIFVRLERISE